MSQWLAMGGYGGYVWPTYIAAALLLGGLAATGLMRLRAAERRAAELEALRPKRRRKAAEAVDAVDPTPSSSS